jgi:hypothetical protein
VYGLQTLAMVVVVGLPVATTPWGSDPFLGGWVATAYFGSRISYRHWQRGPTTQNVRKSPGSWTKSIEINSNRFISSFNSLLMQHYLKYLACILHCLLFRFQTHLTTSVLFDVICLDPKEVTLVYKIIHHEYNFLASSCV